MVLVPRRQALRLGGPLHAQLSRHDLRLDGTHSHWCCTRPDQHQPRIQGTNPLYRDREGKAGPCRRGRGDDGPVGWCGGGTRDRWLSNLPSRSSTGDHPGRRACEACRRTAQCPRQGASHGVGVHKWHHRSSEGYQLSYDGGLPGVDVEAEGFRCREGWWPAVL